jgi:hypothetical protein
MCSFKFNAIRKTRGFKYQALWSGGALVGNILILGFYCHILEVIFINYAFIIIFFDL